MFALSSLLYFIHLILTTRLAASSSQISQPVVNTSSGVISGFTQSVRLRNATVVRVDTFLGVPFAQPPLGALRFRSPVPVAFWNGVRNATQWPNTCWQAKYTSSGQIWGTLCNIKNVRLSDWTRVCPLRVRRFVHWATAARPIDFMLCSVFMSSW